MKHVHFIGIGGIGMSALALILLQKGVRVTGSDLSASYVVQKLRKAGAEVFIGHFAENVVGATEVVYNTQVVAGNPEYDAALAKKIKVIHRSDLLAELMEESDPLLVGGTHGKTTTSSLLAHTLFKAGEMPSYAIGGMVPSLGANGGFGLGRYFVAEACESDGTFLKYPAFGEIITNCDNDHLDFWKTEENLMNGYKLFAEKVAGRGPLFWCKDDEKLSSLNLQGISYGFNPLADLVITSFKQEGWKSLFSFTFRGKEYKEIALPLIGRHNVLNGAAVFGLCLTLNISEERLRAAFESFEGVGRRAEKKGEVGGVVFYDDYAHHPTEIAATLGAMRAAAKNGRLIVAFQPHRYTRTQDCMEQFPDAFKGIDELILTEIYPAMEKPIPGITSEVLMGKIKAKSAFPLHLVSRKEIALFLKQRLQPGDVLVTMGAGDITQLCPEIIQELI
jgi:UDP-N-acetylmuramate--alanine ligase